MNRVHYSSATDLHATPQWFFDLMEAEAGGFDLDACALPENAKCRRYYTPDEDGLSQVWRGKVWCNPPYGRGVGAWPAKAHQSVRAGSASVVYLLVAARTDTSWWFAHVAGKAWEIRFIKGRLRFGGSQHSAPFPSALAIYRPGDHAEPRVRFVDLDEVRRALCGR